MILELQDRSQNGGEGKKGVRCTEDAFRQVGSTYLVQINPRSTGSSCFPSISD